MPRGRVYGRRFGTGPELRRRVTGEMSWWRLVSARLRAIVCLLVDFLRRSRLQYSTIFLAFAWQGVFGFVWGAEVDATVCAAGPSLGVLLSVMANGAITFFFCFCAVVVSSTARFARSWMRRCSRSVFFSRVPFSVAMANDAITVCLLGDRSRSSTLRMVSRGW